MDKRQRILIVDDAEFNREILKEFLGEAYSYLEAENGIQAIRILEENPEIDLMLLDINMPQMNGFEVLEWMNRLLRIEETPVIMISSEESVDAMRKAYEMGITDYITRPFDSVMPRMNGLDAARTIREMKRRDAMRVPIIAMSANAFAEDLINSRMAGMNVHLAKPLDAEKMIVALKQCMADNRDIKLHEDL